MKNKGGDKVLLYSMKWQLIEFFGCTTVHYQQGKKHKDQLFTSNAGQSVKLHQRSFSDGQRGTEPAVAPAATNALPADQRAKGQGPQENL